MLVYVAYGLLIAHVTLGALQSEYHYVVRDWLKGDPAFPQPPSERLIMKPVGPSNLFTIDIN